MNILVLATVLATTALSTYADDAMRAAFPAGCDGKNTVCEASGSKLARGVNMLHFRLEQAKAQKAKSKDACQVEAQAAVALSQGLPKFRDQLKASGGWGAGKMYQTRWDGTLSEADAFGKIAASGDAAKKLYADCGGKKLTITEADEMAFKPKVDPTAAPVSIDNRDQRNYDYEVGACPKGNSARGAVVAMGSSNLGAVDGCTLKITGAGSTVLKAGTTCTISGGVVTCR